MNVPSDATHKMGRTYIKNPRENTPRDGAYNDGYIYAYDFLGWQTMEWMCLQS